MFRWPLVVSVCSRRMVGCGLGGGCYAHNVHACFTDSVLRQRWLFRMKVNEASGSWHAANGDGLLIGPLFMWWEGLHQGIVWSHLHVLILDVHIAKNDCERTSFCSLILVSEHPTNALTGSISSFWLDECSFIPSERSHRERQRDVRIIKHRVRLDGSGVRWSFNLELAGQSVQTDRLNHGLGLSRIDKIWLNLDVKERTASSGSWNRQALWCGFVLGVWWICYAADKLSVPRLAFRTAFHACLVSCLFSSPVFACGCLRLP